MTAPGPCSTSRVLRFFRASVLAIACAVLVSVLLAPAASAKRTTTSSTSTTVPTVWDPRIEPIADQVAQLRGLPFVRPVAADFLDDAAFEKQVAIDLGTLTKQEKQDLAREQVEFRALGLIGPEVNLRDEIESLQASGAAAYYVPKTKKITVKGTSLDDAATRVTVAHELTHAFQDQHFDLQKLDKEAATTHGSSACARWRRAMRCASRTTYVRLAVRTRTRRRTTQERGARPAGVGRDRTPRVCPNRCGSTSRRRTTSVRRCSRR